MNTRPRCWIEVLSSLTGLELLAGDLPSHKWLGYYQVGGCGTAVHAAQKLNRQWIGIDITHLAISRIEIRLSGKQRAGLCRRPPPDHAPDLNFKKAKAESNAAQKELI